MFAGQIQVTRAALAFALFTLKVTGTNVRYGDLNLEDDICNYSQGPKSMAAYDPISFLENGTAQLPFGCVSVADGNPLGCDAASPICGHPPPACVNKDPPCAYYTTPVPASQASTCEDLEVSGCSPHITFSGHYFKCLSVANYDVPVTVWESGSCTGQNFQITASGDYNVPFTGHCITIDC